MAASAGPEIVEDGLVLYLDAANDRSYPGTGTTWTDLSGRGNNCTLINGVTYSNTGVNNFSTDGVNDYIESPPLQGSGTSSYSQSYCLWVKPSGTAGNILSMSRTNPQGSWNMPPVAATGSKFRGKFWSNSYLYQNDSYTQGLWYYVCLTFNYDPVAGNRFQKLYVNGVLQSSSTATYSASGVDNYIFLGQANPGADNTGYFSGSYGLVQIYTQKCLSDLEISKNFNATRSRFGV